MKFPCSVRTIRGQWFKPGIAALFLLLAADLYAQGGPALLRSFREKPTAANRQAVERYAAVRTRTQAGALAYLALGIADLDRSDFASARTNLRKAREFLPRLKDYTGYLLASAEFGVNDFDKVKDYLDPVWDHKPASPLVPKAALLAARADIARGKPGDAIKILKKDFESLPQPAGLLALATALENTGDRADAAAAYQKVYYEYPLASEASQAQAAISRFQSAMGAEFPPAMPQAMLERASALITARRYADGKRELEKLTSQLAGAQRDLALVRIGAADYFAGETSPAYRYLASLKVEDPEADAERLYYLLSCARRTGNDARIAEAVEELGRRYPKSPWRFSALLSAGNHYLLVNDASKYVPFYAQAARDFPDDERADYCHWKVTWNSYIRRKADAAGLLHEHLERYPLSEKANSALYFLGRMAEEAGDPASAKSFFREVVMRYPNTYYAVLARERLEERNMRKVVASGAAVDLISRISLPKRVAQENFQPNSITKMRLERARELEAAGLEDWAENELRFGSEANEQPHILVMELARTAVRRGAPDDGIRYIKRFVPSYLRMPLESAPPEFWQLAFPLPYRSSLERYTSQHSLDKFLMAGLVRQESEFNTRAVSRSRAYGLTQVMPSTGRELSRKVGLRRFSTSMLLQPDVNLRLGTYYLRSLLNQLEGSEVAALASYNAGKSRAVEWMKWGDFREPAEFIETIPFSETRNYIQSVLRNADFYRRLYAVQGKSSTAAAATPAPKIAPKAAAAKSVSKKATPKKATPKKKAAGSAVKRSPKKR